MIIGIIGVGSMGENHVRVLTEIKKVDRILIYDPNHKRANKIADIYDVDVTKSIKSLLRRVDAVSICSPTRFHFKHVRECIKASKHVIVEKPLASTYEEGVRILKMLPEKKDLVFGVGHIERFNPIVSELASLDIEITYIGTKRHNPASTRITDSTVVEDLMIHDIDIVFNVFHPEKDDFILNAAGNKNVVQILVDFGDTIASLSASRISSKKIRTIYIENDEMTVEGDFMTQELFIYRRPSIYQTINEKYLQENVIEKVLINKVEPLKVELKTFVDAIDGKTEFPISVDHAIKNLKICEMIRRFVL